MTIIYTESEKLNNELEKLIENSRAAYYTKYLLEEDNVDVVILSVQNNKFEYEKLLFQLRKKNIRVILLLEDDMQKEMEIAIRLGIYDLIIGRCKKEDILNMVKNKNNFSNIAEIYKKTYKVKEDLSL